MKSAPLFAGVRMPVAVEAPAREQSLENFVSQNKGALDEQLLESGAILFRGFSVDTDGDFQRFVNAVSNDKMEYVYGSTPRTKVGEKIYTATEYPANQEIPLHNELSYHTEWPRKIAFCCLTPAMLAGETPLADMRLVNQRLGQKIIDVFEERKVLYVRHYRPNVDVPWQQVFQTDSKEAVANFCDRNGIEAEWLPDDVLRTRQVCQGVTRHPVTDERVLFNQAHLFHVSSLGSENAANFITTFGADGLPRNSYFGDGTEIPVEYLDEIRTALKSSAVKFIWKKGDVVLVDNIQVAHGRRPFKGARKVLAALMDPMSSRN